MKDNSNKMNYILNYEDLQLGDIVLESGHKLHSEAIKTYTKSNFSHAMICVDNASIIHAENAGIFSLNPQRLLVENITDLKVLRLKKQLSIKDNEGIEFFLRNKIGSTYSKAEAFKVVKKDKQANNNYQFCSRLVAQAYSYINYKIVNDIDFCSPADIEESNLFYTLENMIRKAEDKDVKFALTRNMIKENQISMYSWLNKTKDLAYRKYNFSIHKINDVDIFLQQFPYEDKIVCDYIIESGYLENYLIEIENNPHMHNEENFINKYEDIENIIHALISEFTHIPSHTNRNIQNYKTSMLNYKNTSLNFYSLHANLYKALLSVSLSRFITLFSVSKKMILEGNKDKELVLVMLQAQQNIEILQHLKIERYNKT